MKCLACADDLVKPTKKGLCCRCEKEASDMRPNKKYGNTPIKPVDNNVRMCFDCGKTVEMYSFLSSNNIEILECPECGYKFHKKFI